MTLSPLRPAFRSRTALAGLATALGLGVSASPAAALDLKFNFGPEVITNQSGAVPVPSSYTLDFGKEYSATRGYGWVREDSLNGSHLGLDMTSPARSRDRGVVADQRLDTLIQTILAGAPTGAWEVAVPNGQYKVTVAAGDPSYVDSRHVVNVEGTKAIDFTPTKPSNLSKTGVATVNVTDGRLTLDGRGGTNVKLQYVDITSVGTPTTPPATTPQPTTPQPTTPTQPGARATVTSIDAGAPAANRLVFSNIFDNHADASVDNPMNPPDLWGVPESHNRSVVRIANSGTAPLTVTSLPITVGAAYFHLLEPAPALPRTLAVGASFDVTVEFTPPSARIVRSGTLTVNTNSSITPSTPIQLAGYIQEKPEDNREPTLQAVVNSVFGYKVNFGTTSDTDRATLNKKGLVKASGDEIISPLWSRLNTSQPVKAIQLAAYHGVGSEALKWYNDGSFTAVSFVTHRKTDNQTILPRPNNVAGVASGQFNPATPKFGFRVGDNWSDPTRNTTGIDLDHSKGCLTTTPCGHRLRFWQLRDASGALVPGSYVMGQDYTSPYINYDYNDNIYLITNVVPAGAPPVAPQGPVIKRIDTGSTTATTDKAGNVWSADTGLFSPSTSPPEGTTATITGTEDDKLYQTYRGKVPGNPPVGQRIVTYKIPLPTAVTSVDLRLLFAELYWTAAGKRVFDVSANGVLRIDDIDLYNRSRNNTAIDEVVDNVVIGSDHTLTLVLNASVDNASIAGIEVRCRTGC